MNNKENPTNTVGKGGGALPQDNPNLAQNIANLFKPKQPTNNERPKKN